MPRRGFYPAAWLLVLTATAFPAGPALPVKQTAPSAATTVLFVGSSYLSFNNLPGMFTGLAEAGQHPVVIGKDIINGTYLKDHAWNTRTQQLIQSRPWDFMVMQGGPMDTVYYEDGVPPLQRPQYRPIHELDRLLRSASPGGRSVYFMNWAFEDGLTWLPDRTETYEDMQQLIYHTSVCWAEDLRIALAPVGWAWRSVIRDSPPTYSLYMGDYNHPNERGSYLSACVLYACLFRESPVGLPYHAGLSADDAAWLQQKAWATWNDPDEDGLPTATDPAPFVKTGDVYFDGAIDAMDVLALANQMAGNPPPAWHWCLFPAAGDRTGKGRLEASDLLSLQLSIVNRR